MVLLDLGLIIHRRGVGECLVPGDQMYHTSCSIKNGPVTPGHMGIECNCSIHSHMLMHTLTQLLISGSHSNSIPYHSSSIPVNPQLYTILHKIIQFHTVPNNITTRCCKLSPAYYQEFYTFTYIT